jgi:hypothetical protein
VQIFPVGLYTLRWAVVFLEVAIKVLTGKCRLANRLITKDKDSNGVIYLSFGSMSTRHYERPHFYRSGALGEHQLFFIHFLSIWALMGL